MCYLFLVRCWVCRLRRSFKVKTLRLKTWWKVNTICATIFLGVGAYVPLWTVENLLIKPHVALAVTSVLCTLWWHYGKPPLSLEVTKVSHAPAVWFIKDNTKEGWDKLLSHRGNDQQSLIGKRLHSVQVFDAVTFAEVCLYKSILENILHTWTTGPCDRGHLALDPYGYYKKR